MARLTGNTNLQRATFRFHGRLADLLSRAGPGTGVPFALNGRIAIKHPIEALGIPHTEVEVILANRWPVDFSYIVRAGDEFDVYPASSGAPESSVRLRPPLPGPPRFVADNHLGRLVTYLRLLGFDTLHSKQLDDAELADLSSLEGRVLLTRDRRLLMRKIVVYGFCLQTREPRQQLLDVLDRFDLRRAIAPWHRCLR
ncbi:MAG: twitching motility protein PilT [Chloroflexota bacterium]|nr:MAG: twitching motility protein PilT [Chloroflexota bacterium]